jgi:tetratricopeptide (TPR) repeat protein
MSEKVSLYNPRDTPPEQLEAMLTGREHLLKEVLDSLREQADSLTRQHWLLRGPRGIGKTHLTGIIHHRVSTDPELSKVYLPLWLGEADVYEVYSPATLLMRIADRLVEAVPGTQLAEALPGLEGTGDEDALFEELAVHLTEESERQKRILLVLMENLDALFESFAPKQRMAQTRQLRSLLLGNFRLLFISTTPTRYLEELSNPKAPLFAHLKERRLNQLKVEEVGALFTKLSQITGRKELLGSGPDAALKQRIIHQLTGGLPRSVVMAFEILRDKEGIQALVEDLRTFLDAQTAYFEARLSRLAPRERAIVTTLALAEQNLTLKEIADKSRLPEKSLSTLVARLEQEGHVEAIEGSGGKGTLYGLSEGLFRIWYQYRKGRLLLEPLVRFLAYWYEPRELEGSVVAMQQRLAQEGPKAGRAARLAFFQLQAAFNLATSEHGRLERQRIWDECRRAVEQGMSQVRLEQLDPMLQQALSRVIDLMFSGQMEEGRAALEKVVDERLEEPIVFEAARFLVQGAIQAETERELRNFEAFRAIARHFGTSRDVATRIMSYCAWSLVVQCLLLLNRYEEAIVEADRILSISEVWRLRTENVVFLSVTALRIASLSELGRHEDAVLAGDEILDILRSGDCADAMSIIMFALNALRKSLEVLGRRREQEEILEHIIERDSSALPFDVRRHFVSAEFELLNLKAQDGRIELSSLPSACEEIGERYKDVFYVAPPELLGSSINALVNITLKIESKPVPIKSVRRLFQGWLSADRAKAASVFLVNPRSVFLVAPVAEVGAWIRQMLEADVSEVQKKQLRLHLRLAELLEAATAKNGEAGGRLQQKLGRIPSELRELYKSLVSTLRKPA